MEPELFRMVCITMAIIRLTSTLLLALLLSSCAMQGLQKSNQLQVFSHNVPAVSSQYAQQADAMFEVLAGELAIKNKAFASSVDHYSKASQLTTDPAVAEQAAKVAIYARDFDAADKNLTRWLELSPDNAQAIQLAGLVSVRQNDTDKAVSYLSTLLKDDAASGYQEIERILSNDTTSKVTLEVMDALRKKQPNVVEGQFAHARLAYRDNKYTEALAALDKVVALEPANRKARLLKNRIRLAMGDADLAISDMRDLVATAGNDDELQRLYARMLVQAKRYDEALSEYAKVQKNNPDDVDVTYTVALLELELHRNTQAEKHFRQLLTVKTHRDDASYYLGQIYESDPDAALKWYRNVKHGQYYVDAQISIGEMLAKKGDIANARSHLGALRAKEKDEGMRLRLYHAEGQLLRKQQRYDDALKLYSEALEKTPGNVDLLYARAMTGDQADRLDILERDLRTIIANEPDNASALNALGYTLAEKTDRLDEALGYIQQALALEPDDPAIIDSMGWVLYRKGDLEGAATHLRKAWAILNDAEVASHLAEVLWAMGQREQARETVKKALLVSPDDERLLKLKSTVSP